LESSNNGSLDETVSEYLVSKVEDDDRYGRFAHFEVECYIRDGDWDGLRQYLDN